MTCTSTSAIVGVEVLSKEMHNTNIQWCHGTVSPVPTCDGCPLRLPEVAVIAEIRGRLLAEQLDPRQVESALQVYGVCTENSRRKRILAAVTAAMPTDAGTRQGQILQLTQEIYKVTSSCYAGVLTDNRGGKVKGYADRFDQITLFPGRMAKAAQMPEAVTNPCPTKPWLDGCRYLWFVNDMGDALSNGVPFEFLMTEIVDVAASKRAATHVALADQAAQAHGKILPLAGSPGNRVAGEPGPDDERYRPEHGRAGKVPWRHPRSGARSLG